MNFLCMNNTCVKNFNVFNYVQRQRNMYKPTLHLNELLNLSYHDIQC